MGRIIRLPGQKVNRLISCVSAYPAELLRGIEAGMINCNRHHIGAEPISLFTLP